jgi:membrane protein required for colicin V production
LSLLDVLLALIVGLSLYGGFRAGLARASVGMIAAIAGVLFGFWFYGVPAAWFRERLDSPLAANMFGFFIVFACTLIVGGLLGQLLSKVFKWTGLSWLDRILGAGFGLVRGVLVAVAFIAILMAFTPRPVPNWMTRSALLPYGLEASDRIAAAAPYEIKEAFAESLHEIRQVWKENVEKARRATRPEKSRGNAPKDPPPRSVDQ